MWKSPTQTPVMSISMPACGYETLSSTGPPRASPKRLAAASTSLEAMTISWMLKPRSAIGLLFPRSLRRFGVAGDELPPQHLPVRAARQFGDEDDPRRDLVRGDPPSTVVAQRPLVDLRGGDYERGHIFAQHRVGDRRHGRLPHGLVLLKRSLDLGGVQLETAAVDALLTAADHVDQAIL